MRKTLESDISIFICPEGTRNFTDQMLLPFKDGAFRLAIATQTPLAVLTVINTDVLLSPESPLALSPGKLVAEWSKPIDTKGMTDDDVESLKQQTAKLMQEILTRHLMSTQK
ncbi:MAG: 1-acyl-sn-glycerol-3-phosphate acyltransferase [Bacteroidota bacterium]|nr:MAG: 1-acyl-sn-glycerol-3-phosphate acyltransferase [Bacteroidota bacterium]